MVNPTSVSAETPDVYPYENVLARFPTTLSGTNVQYGTVTSITFEQPRDVGRISFQLLTPSNVPMNSGTITDFTMTLGFMCIVGKPNNFY